MLGAIIGDAVGSRFEFCNIHSKNFDFLTAKCFLTDDSIMTIALADAIMQWDNEGKRGDYKRLSELAVEKMRFWGNEYPDAGYGCHFEQWLSDCETGAYNSCGNGAAMRVSPVGWVADSIEECIAMSKAVTEVTHNHPDGIKGAESTAVQIFLAKKGMKLAELKEYEQSKYYKIDYDMVWLLKNYEWHSLCDGTCQPAFECLYESSSFEDAIRNCMAVGGDCDTTGAICGGIAEAVWGIPKDISQKIKNYMDEEQLEVVAAFYKKYWDGPAAVAQEYKKEMGIV